uniref:Uncharacterized protein n=1 Tax=Anguilla anguilla TaxID=7936 RepID=A0A0E9XDA7_ANGAN
MLRMVSMGSVFPAWSCTDFSLTLMKGLYVNSSPTVEGMVGSPLSYVSLAQASFFRIASLFGSTCLANLRLLMVYSCPQ